MYKSYYSVTEEKWPSQMIFPTHNFQLVTKFHLKEIEQQKHCHIIPFQKGEIWRFVSQNIKAYVIFGIYNNSPNKKWS
jgi:hypothetical protein